MHNFLLWQSFEVKGFCGELGLRVNGRKKQGFLWQKLGKKELGKKCL
jgi:hypothetical protein